MVHALVRMFIFSLFVLGFCYACIRLSARPCHRASPWIIAVSRPDMNDDQTDSYLKTLIYYVKREANLWKTDETFNGKERVDQTSWNFITREINNIYSTANIKVVDVKSTWERLLDAYEEAEEYETATIFPFCRDMVFINEKKHSIWSKFDGFSRNNGKFLVWLQLMLNITFVVLVIYVVPFSEERKLCTSEFTLPLLLLFAASVQLTYLIFVPQMLSFLRSSSGNECARLTEVSGLSLPACFVGLSQLPTIGIQATKLHRPPTLNEMSTVMVTELAIALLFTFPLITSHWTEFYLESHGCRQQ